MYVSIDAVADGLEMAFDDCVSLLMGHWDYRHLIRTQLIRK